MDGRWEQQKEYEQRHRQRQQSEAAAEQGHLDLAQEWERRSRGARERIREGGGEGVVAGSFEQGAQERVHSQRQHDGLQQETEQQQEQQQGFRPWQDVGQGRQQDHGIEYERIYHEVMRQAPSHVLDFPSRELSSEERQRAIAWMRSETNLRSPMALQIKYAFSVPTADAIGLLAAQQVRKWISCGSGTGYWESLMQRIAHLTVVCFDTNSAYPEEMRFTHIDTGGSERILEHATTADGLFLSWPDDSEASTFGVDCLRAFPGNVVAHVGELRGETLSANPWGESTSAACQEYLTQNFRLFSRIELPRWPYQRDALTIWRRASHPIDCSGALFVAMMPPQPR